MEKTAGFPGRFHGSKEELFFTFIYGIFLFSSSCFLVVYSILCTTVFPCLGEKKKNINENTLIFLDYVV